MSDSKYLVNFNSEQEAIDAGYRKASRQFLIISIKNKYLTFRSKRNINFS